MGTDSHRPRDAESAASAVLRYHDRTKHFPYRYASGPGGLDWANQPNPFRRFAGAKLHELPFVAAPHRLGLREIVHAPTQRLTLDAVSLLLEHSVALSAWKSVRGNRWSLRCNPSSGNLHPTETYVILPALAGLSDAAGVYHYRADAHALESRAALADDVWRGLSHPDADGELLVGLSSILWREAWKYGERAFRYCQHDVGHAIAAIAYAARALGWTAHVVADLSDEDVAGLLGVDRREDFAVGEREHPDVVIRIGPHIADVTTRLPDHVISRDAVEGVRRAVWAGVANALSGQHVTWQAIDDVSDATVRLPTDGPHSTDVLDAESSYARAAHRAADPRVLAAAPERDAFALCLQRRSAVDFDGRTDLSAERFFEMLAATLPSRLSPPLDSLDTTANIHLALFVHRVPGLEPGLYLLVRSESARERLRAAFDATFEWAAVPGAPDTLPIVQLATGDARDLARSISCGQDIAADGAFSLGMIANFAAPIAARGAWFYRHLYWECGAVGQVFYLESERAGIAATGIGCFFDDSMHDLLGIHDHSFQSLYHLAVGQRVDDPRISTLPAYVRRALQGD